MYYFLGVQNSPTFPYIRRIGIERKSTRSLVMWRPSTKFLLTISALEYKRHGQKETYMTFPLSAHYTMNHFTDSNYRHKY